MFELAFRWLRARLPSAAAPALVHGDYRIGNVIFGPEGVRTILDWELCHLGDPAEDLGWLCVRAWRFGSDDKPAGGIGTREELFAAYERGGGAPVDPLRVRFWEVFGNPKWAIIHVQAKTHLDGMVRSVELAAIGRAGGERDRAAQSDGRIRFTAETRRRGERTEWSWFDEDTFRFAIFSASPRLRG